MRSTSIAVPPADLQKVYPADRFLLAVGQGALSKGALICERVADTAARAELAKLIRVHVQERVSDRARERTGRPVEQDIEVVREELVSEMLRDVKIVDRAVDAAKGTCSSTAVMPKASIAPSRDDGPSSLPPPP